MRGACSKRLSTKAEAKRFFIIIIIIIIVTPITEDASRLETVFLMMPIAKLWQANGGGPLTLTHFGSVQPSCPHSLIPMLRVQPRPAHAADASTSQELFEQPSSQGTFTPTSGRLQSFVVMQLRWLICFPSGHHWGLKPPSFENSDHMQQGRSTALPS